MNFVRIAIYTLLLTVLQVAAQTVTYWVFGDIEPIGSLNYLVNLYLPSVVVSIFVLSLLAKHQNYKVYTHLFIVCALSASIIIGTSLAIVGEYILSPFWYVDLMLSIACILISVKTGSYLKDR